ncbi:PglL family O-oligosaccharyltransferase [Vibrio profundum]|uniref:PglL family O-oligosaccharyltransferase n=1 Tax=Vibrio profundum TaxID=2910247 RepID=UPI003D0EE0A4
MAILHTEGTHLEPHAPVIPLNKRFLISLACVFLVAMHFFTPNPGGEGLALSFNTATWAGLSVTFAIGLYQVANNQALRYSRLTFGLTITCILLTLPEFYLNADLTHSMPRLIGLWAGLLLFVLLQQFQFSNSQKQRLLWFIVLAVLIEALFGFVQYFVLPAHNIFNYNTLINRPYGIFQQPNVMASFLATGLVLSGYLLARHPVKYRRRLGSISLLYVTPSLTVPLLIVLASRTGWLAAVISVALLTPYLYHFATKRRASGWCLSLLLGLGFGAIMALSNDGIVDGKGSQQTILEKSNLDSPRSYIYHQALDMFIEKPLTGYGYGRFEPSYLLYTARQHQLNPSYHVGLPSLSHPHNELLYWAVEGGVVPVLGILLAAALVLRQLYLAKKGTRLALLALFLPIVLHSQLEYPFYHSAIHWIIFVMLLYWVDQRSVSYRKLSFHASGKSLLRVTSLILPICISLYMLSALQTNSALSRFEKSVPPNPELLKHITNPIAWQSRLDWDIYSTYLRIGLLEHQAKFIQPYIDWSEQMIKIKPRPAFYNNLILAYQGLGEDDKANQVRAEANYLFPNLNFSNIKYLPPSAIKQKLKNK